MDALASEPGLLRFGTVELDLDKAELREAGTLRRLPAQPLRVLTLLAGRPGEVVSRKEIRHCLWGDRKDVEVDQGINFCLNQIRSVWRAPAEASHYLSTADHQSRHSARQSKSETGARYPGWCETLRSRSTVPNGNGRHV